jgi:hypothetical protein
MSVISARQWVKDAFGGLFPERFGKSEALKTITNSHIEFAKQHVKAALQSAYDNHELEYIHKDPTGGDAKKLVKKSILNAYPLSNIK